MNFTSIFQKEVKTIHGVRAFRKKISEKVLRPRWGRNYWENKAESTGVETAGATVVMSWV